MITCSCSVPDRSALEIPLLIVLLAWAHSMFRPPALARPQFRLPLAVQDARQVFLSASDQLEQTRALGRQPAAAELAAFGRHAASATARARVLVAIRAAVLPVAETLQARQTDVLQLENSCTWILDQNCV